MEQEFAAENFVPDEQPKATGGPHKIIPLATGALLLAGAAAYGAYYYFVLPKPLEVLEQSFENIANAESWEATFRGPQGSDWEGLSGGWVSHKDPAFSKLELAMKGFGQNKNESFSFEVAGNLEEVNLRMDYSEMESLLLVLYFSSPQLFETETYALSEPLLFGEKWLQIPAPEEKDEPQTSTTALTDEEGEQIRKDFLNTLMVVDFERNEERSGKEFYRIGMGFQKEKLIAFLESLKQYKLDVDLKDLNSLIDIVRETDGWDGVLGVFLVEKDTGNLVEVALAIPRISQETLQENIKETLQEEDGSSVPLDVLVENLPFFSENAKKQESDKPQGLIALGTISFTNYNSAPLVERPQEVVKLEDLSDPFVRDLPLFSAIFLGALQGEGSQLLP